MNSDNDTLNVDIRDIIERINVEPGDNANDEANEYWCAIERITERINR